MITCCSFVGGYRFCWLVRLNERLVSDIFISESGRETVKCLYVHAPNDHEGCLELQINITSTHLYAHSLA
jgi:hypothetical protein